MEKLIKQINDIMGNFEGSQLTIRFHTDGEIVFGIYEQEIPIIVKKKDKTVYLDCETTHSHLTADMLNELSQIIKMIEENIDIVLSCV